VLVGGNFPGSGVFGRIQDPLQGALLEADVSLAEVVT
jgi:hypothetical protein